MGSRKFLVLTNDAGLGHRHAALATVEALEERYGHLSSTTLINPLEEPGAPTSMRNVQTNFNNVVQRAPLLYSFGHGFANSYLPTRFMERMEIHYLSETIDQILGRTRPDLILTTHPTYIYLLVDYRKRNGNTWPIAVLATDLAHLQRLWFRREVDLYLVPTADAAQLAARRGISPERVHVTGIPVDPCLAESGQSKLQLRSQFGWLPELPVILAVGGRRVREFKSFLRAINRAQLPVQLVVVAGDDEDLLADIRVIEWQIPTHIYGYVDDFPNRLRAADAIVCKAGGLTVAESLAAGVPMFIIQCMPMHEKGNAAYVVASGAGIRAESPNELVEALRGSLANEGRLLAAMAENARRMGRPQAAYDVAELLWTLVSEADPETGRVTPSL